MTGKNGKLFVVATPIGNMQDLSARAREVLESVALIAAEDTRHSRKLLAHYAINTKMVAYHDHNEREQTPKLLRRLQAGESIALISDAGTPLISDPGYRVVQAAHEAGITVSPIPGPSALTAALSVAGLPTDRFCFEGFLPARQKARRDRLANLRGEPRTMVFYESVHRMPDCISDMIDAFGEQRRACISRELSKLHEQVRLASLGQLRAQLGAGEITAKGEFVIVVAGGVEAGQSSLEIDALLNELAGKLPDKEVARIVSNVTGEKRNALYKRLLDL